MSHVVAFEGTWPADAIVAWGAAAIHSDGRLVNSLSGQHIPWSDSIDIGSSGLPLVEVPAIEVKEAYRASPLVVLAIRKTGDAYRFFLPDTGRLSGYLGARYNKEARFYVFRDPACLDEYAVEAIYSVVAYILRESPIAELGTRLLNECLALRPHDPYAHSLRVFYSGASRERTTMFARAALRSDGDRKTFEMMLEALGHETQGGSRYWLKYEDGIAAGGGLDADDAARQFAALAGVHRRLRPILLDRAPFLESETEIPQMRIYEMRAASANIGFGITLPNRPLIERVARYFELQLLQEILRGQVPAELASDSKFQDDLEKLVSPGEETRVLQTGLGREDIEPVVFEPFQAADATPDARAIVFGVVQGVVGEVKRAELKLFPGYRELVSTADTGFDSPPEGSIVFQRTNDFLFRPAIFELQRFVATNGRYRFYLQRIHVLAQGEREHLTAFPSTIVRGAFCVPTERIEVSWQSTGVLADNVLLSTYPSSNHTAADRLIDSLGAWASEKEWEAARSQECTWISPTRPPRPTALLRLLVAVSELGGDSLLSDVIAETNRRYGVLVRRNNTLREINRSQRFLTIDDDDRVRPTEEGKLLVRIFKMAGGSLGQSQTTPGSSTASPAT